MAMRRIASASARAFVSPRSEGGGGGPGGGNPVSIFLPSEPTTEDQRIKLAQTCPWESIVIENETGSSNDSLPIFHFFMPSGEEVSFCGHAAIGACSFLANKKSLLSHEKNLRSFSTLASSTTVTFLAAADRARFDAKVTGNEAELFMDTEHCETNCSSPTYSLEDVLSELGLGIEDLPEMSESNTSWPSFVNSSVARPKTLIPISMTERLHAATPPPNPTKFREMCDSIDSTGIYLYSTFGKGEIENAAANNINLAFECRQFPRSSGYPEDPATGIAAGALAASLHKRQIMSDHNEENGHSIYDVFQGTSMGRPSKIKVKIGEGASKDASSSLSISYSGLVVFDSLSHLDLE